jgi:hypothetical protein
MRSLSGLAFLHLVANAVLLWLGYYWLGIGESRASTLLWSAAVALFVVVLACSAYGAAFAYFQSDDIRRPLAAWRSALRHLLPLSVAAISILVVYFLLAFWSGYSATPAAKIASYLTLTLRKPVRPSAVLRVLDAALWLVRWMILPAVLLPVIANIARRGWRGLSSLGTMTRKWWYWLEAPLLLLCAVWLPLKLLGWIPRVNGFGMEALSFALRAGAAYLLFAAAWLALAFVTSGGKPRLTQPNTTASP